MAMPSPILCPRCNYPFDADNPPMRLGKLTLCPECYDERLSDMADRAAFGDGSDAVEDAMSDYNYVGSPFHY